MAVYGSENGRKTNRDSRKSRGSVTNTTHLPKISRNLPQNAKKPNTDKKLVLPKIDSRELTSMRGSRMKRGPETQIRPFQILERKRWHYTDSPTPLTLYVSYYVPRYDPFLNKYVDENGEPFVRESQQHLVHGMVLNKEGRSFHPPIPPTGSETPKSHKAFQRKTAKYINMKRTYFTNRNQ